MIFQNKHENQYSGLSSVIHTLLWLRNLAITIQLLLTLFIHFILQIFLPLESLFITITVLVVFNVFVMWRLRQDFPVSEMEVAAHLTFDSFVLAALLYQVGGSMNPFVSLFLVPTALAASFLSARYVVSIATLCILLYSHLMLNHQPLPSAQGRFGGDFNLHIIGMWVNFILASLVTVFFVTEIAFTSRRRARKISEQEQQLIKNEYIVSLGTLAAGTAHEISTPLSNIGMMADELFNNPEDAEQVKAFALSIKQQEHLCSTQLSRLRFSSDQAISNQTRPVSLNGFIEDLVNQWSAMRSDIKIHRHLELENDEYINPDITLNQAITNLLNNAADASAENNRPEMIISSEIKNDCFTLMIDDYGKGLTSSQQDIVGDISFTTKENGLGIGLVLTHASLARYNGELKLQKRDNGLRTIIRIPLTFLKDKHSEAESIGC